MKKNRIPVILAALASGAIVGAEIGGVIHLIGNIGGAVIGGVTGIIVGFYGSKQNA